MKRLFISRAIRLRSRVPGGSAMSEARRHRIVAWWSVAVFASAFGSKKGDSGFESKFDLDQSDEVGFSDFFLFAGAFGQSLKAGKMARPGVRGR